MKQKSHITDEGAECFSDYLRLPARGMDAVFGNDNRQLVNEKDRSVLPYCAIVYTKMKFSSGLGRGTGFMISRNIMLTAAHNVYNFKNKEECSELSVSKDTEKFYPGKWIFCNNYRQYGKAKNDWAVVYVDWDENINIQAMNYMCPGTGELEVVSGKNAEVAGFPAEVPGGPAQVPGVPAQVPGVPAKAVGEKTKELYTEKGVIQEYDNLNKVLKYTIDTSPGDSGCPVMFMKEDKSYWAIGIHSRGDKIEKCNKARAIDADIMRAINDMPDIVKRSVYGSMPDMWNYLLAVCKVKTQYQAGGYGECVENVHLYDDIGLIQSYAWCDGNVVNKPIKENKNVYADSIARVYEKALRKCDDMTCIPSNGIYAVYKNDEHIGIYNVDDGSVIECCEEPGIGVRQQNFSKYAPGEWTKWSDIYWCPISKDVL